MSNNHHDYNSDDEAERQRLLQSIPIVDLNENILPLPGGRRAHTLAQFSQTDNKEEQVKIDTKRAAFEKELEQLDGLDDPLEVYMRYLHWITDTFPTGDNKESRLYEVLRKTCLQLQEDTRYTLDLRYLKCWLQYAEFVDKPKDIYDFLMQKGIGQNFALFYEEYSKLYEKDKKYKEAQVVLEKGIERRAQPFSRLEQNLKHLVARIGQIQQQSTSTTKNQLNSLLGQRTILGVKSDPKLRQSMSQTDFNSMQNISSSSSSSMGLPRRSLGNTSSSSQQQRQQKPRTFTICSDQVDDLSPSTLQDTIFPSIPTSPSKLPKASLTRFSRHPQENMPNVEKFGSSTLPLDPNHVRPAKFQVDICRDNDESDNDMIVTNPEDGWHSETNQSSTSSSPPPLLNEANVHPERHAAILEERLRLLGDSCITTRDCTGKTEIIVAHKDCLGEDDGMEPMSPAELRILQQVDRTGKPQKINGKAPERFTLRAVDESIPHRLERGRSPTQEYTAETKAAMQSINALFSNQEVELDEANDLDDDSDNDSQVKRRRNTYVNEND
ncbi:Mad3/BUB1 homology region 1-domain-containing protein [Chlamydoabsidia padenii]|nr:Mad3/BUB1 homology region 1-domain-containing protein [Chlamydoabsidia padenii]